MQKIGVLVGSLRKESYSRKIAENVARLIPAGYEIECIQIGDLPLYNQEYDEKAVPGAYKLFRNLAKEMYGFIFVTPEYNRSIPAPLKNAIDVGSRPKGKGVWDDKAAGIISVSPGELSAFGANHHLRQSLVFFNMRVVQQPEMYLGNVATLLDEAGNVKKEATMQRLQSFVEAFIGLMK